MVMEETRWGAVSPGGFLVDARLFALILSVSPQKWVLVNFDTVAKLLFCAQRERIFLIDLGLANEFSNSIHSAQ